LTGVAVDSVDLGTFTGATIADNVTIKAALQALETSLELKGAASSIANLVTLSGVAAEAVNLGTFTGATIPDSSTVKAALQAVETMVEAIPQASVASGSLVASAVLDLNASPVEMVAAPGAGKIIVIDEIELFMDFGTAAYVRDGGNEELVVQYSGGVDVHAFATATDTFLTSAASARRIIKPVIYDSAAVNFDPATADNEAVQLYITESNVITGDSVLSWKVKYHTITLLV
jgi:hypothetical protein